MNKFNDKFLEIFISVFAWLFYAVIAGAIIGLFTEIIGVSQFWDGLSWSVKTPILLVISFIFCKFYPIKWDN